MKAKLEFTIQQGVGEEYLDETSALRRAINADKAYRCIRDILDEIFRPNRKHGYSDHTINKLLDSLGEKEQEVVGEVIDRLESMTYEIVNELVDMDDYD